MQTSNELHNILGHPLALNKVVVMVGLREVTSVTVGDFNGSHATGTTLTGFPFIHQVGK
jgi:hypothetical protein